jgi:hypothetical protein
MEPRIFDVSVKRASPKKGLELREEAWPERAISSCSIHHAWDRCTYSSEECSRRKICGAAKAPTKHASREAQTSVRKWIQSNGVTEARPRDL